MEWLIGKLLSALILAIIIFDDDKYGMVYLIVNASLLS